MAQANPLTKRAKQLLGRASLVELQLQVSRASSRVCGLQSGPNRALCIALANRLATLAHDMLSEGQILRDLRARPAAN